jgi:hypothetical protein
MIIDGLRNMFAGDREFDLTAARDFIRVAVPGLMQMNG